MMFEKRALPIHPKTTFLGLAGLAGLVLLGFSVNALFSLGFNQSTERIERLAPVQEKREINHEALFGAYEGQNGPLQESGLSAQLKGVFATDNPSEGSAVISISGRQSQLFTVGDRIAGNAIIKEIHADYVVLEEAGERSVLRLPKKTL